VSEIVYDAGVLVAADRNERRVWADHVPESAPRIAYANGTVERTRVAVRVDARSCDAGCRTLDADARSCDARRP
jgi:hypothetical protein